MASTKHTILIVDDHADTRELLQLLLRRLGYGTVVAGSVQEAINVCGTAHVDLLLSDVGLPDGSGLDLLQKLAPMGVTRGVALTGHGRESDIQAAREAGFASHLLKPIDLKQLQAVVESLLEDQ